MEKLAIRLDEKTAKTYGKRVLLPGTAEHARYLRDKLEEPSEQPGDEPKASESDEEEAMPPSEESAYEVMTVPALRAVADDRGVSHKGLRKADLIQALQDAEV